MSEFDRDEIATLRREIGIHLDALVRQALDSADESSRLHADTATLRLELVKVRAQNEALKRSRDEALMHLRGVVSTAAMHSLSSNCAHNARADGGAGPEPCVVCKADAFLREVRG